MADFFPEGELIKTELNRQRLSSRAAIADSIAHGDIVEAPCIICDNEHNLIVDFGFIRGIIPRSEGALGIDEGTVRDIALISRVNKIVCFRIMGFSNDKNGRETLILSRKEAQRQCYLQYLSKLISGDIIPAKVTHLEQFGCFVDIGCGIASMIPIDAISVSRILHPADRFYVGQRIKVVIKGREGRKFNLTHKELLGTWEENAARFTVGETVSGIIRSIESYGVFVELMPNLAGLAELRENVGINQHASVYIKAIIPEKMKVKLIIVDSFDMGYMSDENEYFISEGHIDRWIYSTAKCGKLIESDFTGI